MILKQRLADGKTQFIDLGNNFVIITSAAQDWSPMQSKDVYQIISYMDYNGKLQHEPLYKDFLHWIYSNDGQLFLNLTSPEYGIRIDKN